MSYEAINIFIFVVVLFRNGVYSKARKHVHIKQKVSNIREWNQDESKEDKINRVVHFLANLTKISAKNNLMSSIRSTLLNLPNVPSIPTDAEEILNARTQSTVVPTILRGTYNNSWNGYPLPVFTCIAEGRLGNVMGEYATMFAIRKLYNVTVVMHEEMKQNLTYFPNLSLPVLTVPFKSEKWKSVTYYGNFHSNNYASIELAASGLLGSHPFVIRGTPFEMQLFHQIRDDIRKEFIFNSNITTVVRGFLKRIKESRQRDGASKTVFIGFHIRLTDYYKHALVFGGLLPGDIYFYRALHYYRTKFPSAAAFIVSSDDMELVRKKFETDKDVFFAPGKSAELDIAILSSCNHSIITLGTYGFWSAYLTGGEVVYPDIKFTKMNYRFSKKFYERSGLTSFTPLPVD